MVLHNSYYFTSKLEIKPQLELNFGPGVPDYFTSKLEIKPQPFEMEETAQAIILHQN